MPIQIISFLIHCLSAKAGQLKGSLLANHPSYCVSEPARSIFNHIPIAPTTPAVQSSQQSEPWWLFAPTSLTPIDIEGAERSCFEFKVAQYQSDIVPWSALWAYCMSRDRHFSSLSVDRLLVLNYMYDM